MLLHLLHLRVLLHLHLQIDLLQRRYRYTSHNVLTPCTHYSHPLGVKTATDTAATVAVVKLLDGFVEHPVGGAGIFISHPCTCTG